MANKKGTWAGVNTMKGCSGEKPVRDEGSKILRSIAWVWEELSVHMLNCSKTILNEKNICVREYAMFHASQGL